MEYGVVICSFNKIAYLRRVVEALCKIEGWKELILSDDHSDDGTLEWAMGSKKFTKIVMQPAHQEYCLNTVRNQGVAASRSSHVVILDADCIPQPNYFNGHNNMFERHGDCLSVGFTDSYNERGENILSEDHRKSYLAGKESNLMSGNVAYGGNIAFPVALWEKVGRFDQGYNGCWGFEDLDFAFRAWKLGFKIVGHRDALARHCLHPIRKDNLPFNRNRSLFEKKNGISL